MQIVFFEKAITDCKTIDNSLTAIQSLGFIKGCICPHFDTKKDRKIFIEKSIKNGDINSVFALENKTALEIHDDNEFYVLKSDNKAKVYFINIKLNYMELEANKKYEFNDF